MRAFNRASYDRHIEAQAAKAAAARAAGRPRFRLNPHTAYVRRDDGVTVPRETSADGGAANTADGRKSVQQCDCGALVVWVKSARTGRNYLAECFPYMSDGVGPTRYYYAKQTCHTHDRHAARLAERNPR